MMALTEFLHALNTMNWPGALLILYGVAVIICIRTGWIKGF